MLALLPSCETTEEYTPEYLREDSPLDPPGTAEARKAQRAERVKEGLFAPGSTVDVQQGRVFLLSRNPDYSDEPSGRMVDAEQAKVISCEGLYYFVELDGGKRGYLRESDLVSPVQLVPTDPVMVNGDLFATPVGDDGTPLPLDENQTYATNATGRTVILVGKTSERGNEFEERKKAVEEGSTSGGDEPPPLPEPSHAAGN